MPFRELGGESTVRPGLILDLRRKLGRDAPGSFRLLFQPRSQFGKKSAARINFFFQAPPQFGRLSLDRLDLEGKVVCALQMKLKLLLHGAGKPAGTLESFGLPIELGLDRAGSACVRAAG